MPVPIATIVLGGILLVWIQFAWIWARIVALPNLLVPLIATWPAVYLALSPWPPAPW